MENLTHSDELLEALDYADNSEELQHWGIKGMKWGIRRFQNKDGSLTPAGRKRYDDDPDNDSDSKKTEEAPAKPKKDPSEMTGADYKAMKPSEMTDDELRRAIERSKLEEAYARLNPESTTRAKERTGKDYKQMRPEDMTDDELNDAINRSRNEQTYRQLNPEPVSKGKVLAEKFINEALIPVAVSAGKNFMDKQMSKIIDKALADNVPKSALQKAKEETEIMAEKAKLAKAAYEIADYADKKANVGKPADKNGEKDALNKEAGTMKTLFEALEKAGKHGFIPDTDYLESLGLKGVKYDPNAAKAATSDNSGSTSKPKQQTTDKPDFTAKPENNSTGGSTGTSNGNSTSSGSGSGSTRKNRVQIVSTAADTNAVEKALHSQGAKSINDMYNRAQAERYVKEMEKRYPGSTHSDTAANRGPLQTAEEKELAERRAQGEAFIKRLQDVGQIFED